MVGLVIRANSASGIFADGSGGTLPLGHVGYNNATQSMTASRMRIDGRVNLAATSFEGIWLSTLANRNAAVSYQSSGGFWSGSGYNLFIPGWDGAGGEQYCGIGQILGVDTAGDSRRGCFGYLLKYGSTFWSAQPSDIKQSILLRGGNDRPMIITKRGTSTRVPGACDGTVCNTRNTFPADFHNDGNNQPNLEDFNNQWIWLEQQWDTVDNELRTKMWTNGGEHNGTTVRQTMASAPGDEVTALDILGFINSVSSGIATNGWGFGLLECQLGTDADLTPPPGFTNSNSANWS